MGLRPHPHRGDVLAAGVVALTTGVVLADRRVQDEWSDGVRLGMTGAAAALVGTLALAAPREVDPSEPGTVRPWLLVLLVTGLLLFALVLTHLCAVLGGDPAGAGAVAWIAATLGVAAATLARWRDVGACTLIAAVAGWIAGWFVVLHLDGGVEAQRAWLTAAAVACALGAVRLRDRHRRHAVGLADAGGLAVLGLASTALYGPLDLPTPLGDGWKVVLLAAGFGLLAYGSVDRERTAAGIGVAVLASFALVVAPGDTLFVWPVVLAVGGLVLIAVGLRPREELPPEPGDPPTFADIRELRR